MKPYPEPIDLKKIKVFPLAQRESLSPIDKILVRPEQAPPACGAELNTAVEECAAKIRSARQRGASVMLLYGAHLIKNGAMAVVISLMEKGWVTHLATNGAGTIHDWELSFLGRTEERVRQNVATGTFGTWEETGRCIQLALLAGGLRSEGYGRSLGRFIVEDGVTFPTRDSLEQALREEPAHPLGPARADLLQSMLLHQIPSGRIEVRHQWKKTSIVAEAFRLNVPFTVTRF